MNRATVDGLLRRDFYPILKQDGFARQRNVARRATEPVVHVVEVTHHVTRSTFSVQLGAHVVTLIPDPADGLVDPVSVREYDCAWRTSVVAGFQSDHDAEFAYGRTPDEAAASIEFMISEWRRQSMEFFTPLTSWPDDFLRAARAAELQPANPMKMLAWARVANVAHDPSLASRIARNTLPRVPETATTLRANLEAISDAAQAAAARPDPRRVDVSCGVVRVVEGGDGG